MKIMTTLLLSSLSMLAWNTAHGEEQIVTDFDKTQLRWRTVNDNVMGGRSQGGFSVSSEKNLVFQGRTSLRNNGGFSSIRSGAPQGSLQGYDGFSIRVKGDGRTYKMTLQTSRTGRWISFWANFPTKAGEWQEIRVPFKKFKAKSFGQPRRNPLVVNSINSIGFMIYDKQAGPFKLEVSSIKVYKGMKSPATIAQLAQKAGSFKTLIAVAKAAGLVDALNGKQALTVFAPTDDAFAKLPKSTLDFLLTKEGQPTLVRILKHHVVLGRVTAKDVLAKKELKTLAGTTIKLGRDGDSIRIGGASLLKTDLEASNGIVHVLGDVMLPPKKSAKLY